MWVIKHTAILTQNNVGGRDTHVFKVHFKVSTMDGIWAQKQGHLKDLIRKAHLSCLHAKSKSVLWKNRKTSVAHEGVLTDIILPSCPNTVSGLTSFTPGASKGTRIILCRSCLRNRFISNVLKRIIHLTFSTILLFSLNL